MKSCHVLMKIVESESGEKDKYKKEVKKEME